MLVVFLLLKMNEFYKKINFVFIYSFIIFKKIYGGQKLQGLYD